MNHETKQATPDMLIEQLTSQLDDLQAWIERGRGGDVTELVDAKKNLEPVIQQAAELIAEYEAFLARFRPVLERMQTMDPDAIRTGRWQNALGDPAAEAKQLLRRVTDAIDHLGGIPARADAWTRAKDGVSVHLSRSLTKEVQEHVGGAEVARRRVEMLVERIGRFMVAQREREQGR